jgi:type II secretory pathway pseudopilin PulG
MKRLKTRYTQLSRHGISLLEVMISIGILSIGLLASLSLIPAGRTLIRKADVENRSAAIIPNAMATMRSLGLFRVNAIDWQSQPPLNLPPALQNDAEPRAFRRTGWVEPVGNPPSGKDTQSIETWFNAPDGNPSLSGGGAPPNERVWIRENGVVIGSVMSNATGSWTKAITLPPPSEMGVQGFAPWGPVNVATTFSFEAYWEKEVPDPENPGQTQLEKQPLNITVTPPPNPPRLPGDSIATAYKHYNLRRRVDREVGDTVVHLRVPEEEQRISNQTAAAATQLEFPAMGETVDTARLDYVFKSRIQLFGSLWRWQVGTRDGRWRRNLTYGNRNEYNTDNPWEPAPGNFNYFPATDPDGNPGSRWVDAEQGEPQDGPDAVLEDDVDWFRIEVEAGQTLSLDWSQTAPDAREHSFSKHNDSIGGPPHLAFPLYFNANGEDESRLLPPADTGPASAVYAMPGDGYVLTRVKLRPAKLDEHGNVDRDNGVQDPLDDDYPHRINTNPQYLIDMTLYRNDRVVAIDPIMCARLDWIVDRFPGSLPHRLKRKRFADFQQVFAGTGSQKSFVIPRLNWSELRLPTGCAGLRTRRKWIYHPMRMVLRIPPTSKMRLTCHFGGDSPTACRGY